MSHIRDYSIHCKYRKEDCCTFENFLKLWMWYFSPLLLSRVDLCCDLTVDRVQALVSMVLNRHVLYRVRNSLVSWWYQLLKDSSPWNWLFSHQKTVVRVISYTVSVRCFLGLTRGFLDLQGNSKPKWNSRERSQPSPWSPLIASWGHPRIFRKIRKQ